MIPNFLIYYAIFCIIVIFLYLRFDLHLNDKYKFLIDIAVALFGFLTIFILIQQQNFNNLTSRNEESKLYNDILTEMFTDSLDDFIYNKDIQYFYNELFHNIAPPQNIERNIILEEVICVKILSAYGNYAAYYYSHIDLSDYKDLLTKHNYRVQNILKILIQSETFKKYLNPYLKNISGVDFVNYMKEHLKYQID